MIRAEPTSECQQDVSVTSLSDSFLEPSHPIDAFAEIIEAHEWPYERDEEGEIAMSIGGGWSVYSMVFRWTQNDEVLQLMCGFEASMIADRLPQKDGSMQGLVALINQHLPVGHFEFTPEDNWIVYRNGLLLKGAAPLTQFQCEDHFEIMISACDRFYPAFQFVLTADMTPEDALKGALMETEGQA